MSESGKVTPSHLSRVAVGYVRQSTLGQVERNSESTARQYDLAARAQALGWPAAAVRVIDADLGISGSVTGQREGFENLVAEIALGQVGIVLALEASRLARDNSAWYRLLDLAGACDTLVGDGDGIYHPGLFNDRLLLGMKGIMSEAELHVLRARLDGGIRNKAARGELRRGLPVGLVWGEADGEILVHPDEAVTGVIAAVFERFAECGSVRGVWLWLRDQGLRWPLQSAGYVRGGGPADITWVEPTYHAVHTTLTHPAYAGAYVYGRTRVERYVDDDGALRTRRRKVPQDQWEVLIPDHHDGFLDWDTYQANQARIGSNIRPEAHEPGAGAVRLGTDVGTDAGLVGLVGVPVEEPVVVVGDEDLPLILGDLATPGTQRPVVVDVALHAGASVDVGAGIGGMGQGGVDRVVGRLHPGDVRWPAAAHVTGGLQRPAQPLVAQPQPHAAHRAALGEAFEDRGDHTRDGLVGMHKDLAVGLAPHQPDRQAAAQLTAGGLVADAAVETGAQHVQFRLAHDALHPQQEAVVEQPRVVDAVTVADQRVTRSG